jgi:GH25 family lysozyme M1 (1,4-beta-N-acetylmuramidase)
MQFDDRGIKGPDISFYQTLRDENGNVIEYVDFDKMKAKGVDFVIIKAGQNTWADPDFDHNWREAKRVGIPRAPYFFLDYRAEGKAQAERFWSLIQDDPGEGPLVVDFEIGSGGWRGLWDFLVRLQELSHYPADRIWIYTGYYYFKDFGPQEDHELIEFLVYGLWLAAYTNNPDGVLVPRPWPTAKMWQRGTTVVYGPDYGVHSLELDWNSFNGDWEEFKKYWIVPNDPTEEETGGNETMKYKVIWSRGVARRSAPHIGTPTQNTYTGLIYEYPSEVEVIEENIPDALDPGNENKKWVKFVDGYYGASEYPDSMGIPRMRMEKIVEPEPEPEPTEPVVVHKIDIYDTGEIAVDGGERF